MTGGHEDVTLLRQTDRQRETEVSGLLSAYVTTRTRNGDSL
jgi:hypothetical protein